MVSSVIHTHLFRFEKVKFGEAMNPVSHLQEEIKLDNKRHLSVWVVMPQVGKSWEQVFLNKTVNIVVIG